MQLKRPREDRLLAPMPSRAAAGAGASAAAGAAGAAGAAASAAGTPEEGSMESAKEEEVLALEDATEALVPASTTLVPAHGPPMTYGPQRRGEHPGTQEMHPRQSRSTPSGASGCRLRRG